MGPAAIERARGPGDGVLTEVRSRKAQVTSYGGWSPTGLVKHAFDIRSATKRMASFGARQNSGDRSG
jgi:hypothetical protein